MARSRGNSIHHPNIMPTNFLGSKIRRQGSYSIYVCIPFLFHFFFIDTICFYIAPKNKVIFKPPHLISIFIPCFKNENGKNIKALFSFWANIKYMFSFPFFVRDLSIYSRVNFPTRPGFRIYGTKISIIKHSTVYKK